MAELLGQPVRHLDEGVKIDPRVHALAVEQVDEVLGGDVARRPGGEGEPPTPPADWSIRVTPASSAA